MIIRIPATETMPSGGNVIPDAATAGTPTASAMTSRSWTGTLAAPNTKMFVGTIDGEIVLVCDVRAAGRAKIAHYGEVAISIKRAYWRLGIGHIAMQAMIDFARSTNALRALSLEVHECNARAIALYSRFGFVEVVVLVLEPIDDGIGVARDGLVRLAAHADQAVAELPEPIVRAAALQHIGRGPQLPVVGRIHLGQPAAVKGHQARRVSAQLLGQPLGWCFGLGGAHCIQQGPKFGVSHGASRWCGAPSG